MNSFSITNVTALNVTNAVLGLSVLSILIFMAVQATREGVRSWRRHTEQNRPPAMPGKRG
jgi:hypothetical protein